VDADDRLIDARVRDLTETRGWPWPGVGVISVGLDDGQVSRYLARETELVRLGAVGDADGRVLLALAKELSPRD
jgi:hypothetical protein